MMDLVTNFIEKLADRDPNTYFVGIDGYRFYMTSNIQKKHPDRVIGAGISEQNAISLATGLALSGKNVYVFMIAAYATRRALDQFKFACYCNANIKVITTLSGLSSPYAGFSHLAIDDISIMKNSPNIEIFNPSTKEEMQKIMEYSVNHKGPMYIADDSCCRKYSHIEQIKDYYSISYHKKRTNICILYTGLSGYFLFNSYEIIKKIKKRHIHPDVYSIYKPYPIDENKIISLIKKYKYIITFELRGEGALSSSIAEIIAKNNLKKKFLPIRLQNEQYNITGNVDYVSNKYLDLSNIDEKIVNFVKKFKFKFSLKTSLNTKKIYDLYIPFGRSCHTTMILQRHNLRRSSQPFDWLIPDNNTIEPLQNRFDLFENFEPFFDKKDFTFDKNKISTSGHYLATNNKYNILMGHEFDVNQTDDQNFEKTKFKFLRRQKRMLENIRNSNSVCFVYIANTFTQMSTTSKIDIQILKDNLNFLQKKYPHTKIDFIIFEHNEKFKIREIKEEKISKNITKYISNHSYQATKETLSDILSIDKILNNYELSNKLD